MHLGPGGGYCLLSVVYQTAAFENAPLGEVTPAVSRLCWGPAVLLGKGRRQAVPTQALLTVLWSGALPSLLRVACSSLPRGS